MPHSHKLRGKKKSHLTQRAKLLKSQVAKKQTQKRQRQIKEAQQTQQRKKARLASAVVPYTAEDRIFLVGEGNFSFARALATLLGESCNVTATCFDSAEVLAEKYPEVEDIISFLQGRAVAIHYGIDATALRADTFGWLRTEYPNKIVFNFPHTGSGIKDTLENIRGNQTLLRGFFASAHDLLATGGEVHVTIKKGEPYDSWRIPSLGRDAGFGLKTAIPFVPELYPGYVHRRTLGFEEKISAPGNEDILRADCVTYVFAKVLHPENAAHTAPEGGEGDLDPSRSSKKTGKTSGKGKKKKTKKFKSRHSAGAAHGGSKK